MEPRSVRIGDVLARANGTIPIIQLPDGSLVDASWEEVPGIGGEFCLLRPILHIPNGGECGKFQLFREEGMESPVYFYAIPITNIIKAAKHNADLLRFLID